ncbi:MAG: anhydro-N-acetylmuramic acid kinase [Brachymonas sp.]|nr:anhydro-N-acetylmuramic acid kinase [Brachymonas sp.]
MPSDSPSSLLCIGLMSGTSLDGVDGALLEIHPDPAQSMRQRAFASRDLPHDLREELLALNTPGDNELHRAALAANALMRVYADVVADLCLQARLTPADIAVVGAHGQTVRHRPQMFDGTGYTLQLVNGALLAELTGITVACDFRSRDVAAGGQGAPLVPAFHAALWGDADAGLAVLNIGGMANLSLLQPGQPFTGFDCGPGNVLLDHWCAQHTGQPFDTDGAWAAQGTVHAGLLQQMLADGYIRQAPPKSTGRDHFNAQWLQQQLADFSELSPVNVQATLAAFTAQAAAQHMQHYAPAVRQLLVCGGGVRNTHLMQQLAAALPDVAVASTSARGIDPQAVEAAAFAWLAAQTLRGRTVDWRSVTGAGAARVPGCLYPA